MPFATICRIFFRARQPHPLVERRRGRWLWAAVLALFTPSLGAGMAAASMQAHAAPAEQAHVQGAGNFTCGRWTAEQPPEMQSQLRVVFANWLGGYVSGYNSRRGGNVLEGTDWEDALAWMDRYCVEHTDEPVASAAGQLIIELHERGSHKDR